MKRTHLYLSEILLFFVFAGIIVSCSTPEKKAEKEIDSFMKKSGTVGLSDAVVKDNKIIYTRY
ncbi:MAG: hypothetical protein A2X05_02475 [Bacteroidetes bacterium GWE2_41_25]|nr:MAG: hypothetical protein A2X03_08615 [Bacteroidetes bacterium GWA2_40_15]OFX99678.1 MAG: hypothetical protein A2X06_01020 [Bacteroidetes bacterium GWC2_40_22]OFY12248.1 MAG: hypothetical protein A2X05_02475 [Bacteroidetes bacterium GWE2_41_25]OFY60677.1 MAG: hypothetical protein A2X04_13155 [Bacteroidetes bacterium GWF2_41_9]HAM11512.1 hypothetical protein [Bacteroidales bacterium]